MDSLTVFQFVASHIFWMPGYTFVCINKIRWSFKYGFTFQTCHNYGCVIHTNIIVLVTASVLLHNLPYANAQKWKLVCIHVKRTPITVVTNHFSLFPIFTIVVEQMVIEADCMWKAFWVKQQVLYYSGWYCMSVPAGSEIITYK